MNDPNNDEIRYGKRYDPKTLFKPFVYLNGGTVSRQALFQRRIDS